MSNFTSVFSAAERLPESDRLRLIDALWDTLRPEGESALLSQWTDEIERRAAILDAGDAQTIPWSTIRDEALQRARDGQAG